MGLAEVPLPTVVMPVALTSDNRPVDITKVTVKLSALPASMSVTNKRLPFAVDNVIDVAMVVIGGGRWFTGASLAELLSRIVMLRVSKSVSGHLDRYFHCRC